MTCPWLEGAQGQVGSRWPKERDQLKRKGKITRVDKEKDGQERLTLSIALLVRAPLDPLLPFLALGINALFANAILDAAQAGARIIALLACFLTIGAGIFDLATLGTNLGLRGTDHTRSERVHMHRQAGIRRRMDGQLGLDGVRGGLGRLIDSVIVGVGVNRSHVCDGKRGEGTVSERMSGGCGGREEGTNGQRANAVRVCGSGTWRQMPSKLRHAQRGRTSAGEG